MIETLVSKLTLDRLEFSNIKNILEVGSRDGKNAIELSKTFSNAKVFAIEGNPDSLEQLKLNIQNFHNISCVEVIVSNYDGRTIFYKIDSEKTITPRLDGNPGASSLYRANPDYPDEKYIQVAIEKECKTLKTICDQNQISLVDLIWIDLQGGEIKALEGLKDLLNRVQYIWAKIAHTPLYLEQPLFPEFNSFMSNSGFELLTPINPQTYSEYALYRRKNLKHIAENSAILGQPWGGLGDNLQFSTLPELFNKQNQSFYISSNNLCRNQEIEDLVWVKNPFIAGISSDPPNCGSIRLIKESNTPSFIERVEQAHNLEMTNIAPKIYIEPHFMPEVSGKILIDLSASGLGAGENAYIKKNLKKVFHRDLLSKIFNRPKLNYDLALKINFTNYHSNKNYDLEGMPATNCNSLEDYVSLLFSCEVFVTIHSGAHSLAAAVKNIQNSRLKKIICIVPKEQYVRGLFVYKGVEYVYG